MIVNRVTCAKIFGVSESTVLNFMKEGMPATSAGVRGGKVEIDTVKAHKWIIQREMRSGSLVRDEDEGENINEERRLLIMEQKRQLEIKNDEAEGLLVPLEDVRIAFNAAQTELASILDGAAGKMSSSDAVVRQRLFDEHRRIRDIYATRLEGFVDGQGGRELDEAASEESSVGVG